MKMNIEMFTNIERTHYGFAIWDGIKNLHESECIYSKEIAESIVKDLENALSKLEIKCT